MHRRQAREQAGSGPSSDTNLAGTLIVDLQLPELPAPSLWYPLQQPEQTDTHTLDGNTHSPTHGDIPGKLAHSQEPGHRCTATAPAHLSPNSTSSKSQRMLPAGSAHSRHLAKAHTLALWHPAPSTATKEINPCSSNLLGCLICRPLSNGTDLRQSSGVGGPGPEP